jgi:hypothetical protein
MIGRPYHKKKDRKVTRMKAVSQTSTFTAVLAAALGWASAASAAPAVKAGDFLASLGVNTHLNYTDGAYADYAQVVSDLDYLGIHRLRDATPNPNGGIPYRNDLTALYAAAAAGNHFDFITNPGLPIGTTLDQISIVERVRPGAVIAVEGPNETNNNPVTYHGLHGKAAAVAYQRDLFHAVHAFPILRHAAVYYYTGLDIAQSLTGLADFANVHPYSYQGQQPESRIAAEFEKQFTMTSPFPKVITEAGYFDVPWKDSGVDDSTQAKNTLNLFLDAFAQGSSQTYVYQLLSAYPDEGIDTQSGLFRLDHSPKPVAVAIHNLTTILSDRGKRGFAPASLDYSVGFQSGSQSHALLLEKSTGVFDLILWSEPADWNDVTHQEIVNPPVPTTVSLTDVRGTIAVYDPTLGTRPFQRARDAREITVNLPDHPIIIEIRPSRARELSQG